MTKIYFVSSEFKFFSLLISPFRKLVCKKRRLSSDSSLVKLLTVVSVVVVVAADLVVKAGLVWMFESVRTRRLLFSLPSSPARSQTASIHLHSFVTRGRPRRWRLTSIVPTVHHILPGVWCLTSKSVCPRSLKRPVISPSEASLIVSHPVSLEPHVTRHTVAAPPPPALLHLNWAGTTSQLVSLSLLLGRSGLL